MYRNKKSGFYLAMTVLFIGVLVGFIIGLWMSGQAFAQTTTTVPPAPIPPAWQQPLTQVQKDLTTKADKTEVEKVRKDLTTKVETAQQTADTATVVANEAKAGLVDVRTDIKFGRIRIDQVRAGAIQAQSIAGGAQAGVAQVRRGLGVAQAKVDTHKDWLLKLGKRVASLEAENTALRARIEVVDSARMAGHTKLAKWAESRFSTLDGRVEKVERGQELTAKALVHLSRKRFRGDDEYIQQIAEELRK